MSNVSATGCIKVVKTPTGGAPEEIRKEWIGVTLPCAPILGFSDGVELEVVTRKEVRKRYCFHVPQVEAIEALEQKSSEAAKWWRQFGYPYANGWFTFGEDEAEIIFGVIRQQIVEITDEMQGNPDR